MKAAIDRASDGDCFLWQAPLIYKAIDYISVVLQLPSRFYYYKMHTEKINSIGHSQTHQSPPFRRSCTF